MRTTNPSAAPEAATKRREPDATKTRKQESRKTALVSCLHYFVLSWFAAMTNRRRSSRKRRSCRLVV